MACPLSLATESVAVTTNVKVPVAVGLPEITPADERFTPGGREEPLAAAQVQVRLALEPDPPVALRLTGP